MRRRYARRGGRATVRGRAYTLYLVSLFALIYLVPLAHAASTAPTLVAVGSPSAAVPLLSAVAASLCWTAQLTGRYWGPLVTQPFLLHVFRSTDLPPTAYLGATARRRLAWAGTATLLTLAATASLTTDLLDRSATAAPTLAVAVGLAALVAVAWLWGQIRATADNLVLAAAVGGAAAVLAATSRTAPGQAGGLWPVAAVLSTTGALLGRVAFRSLRTIDLPGLARDAARFSQAQAYAWTGTLHHALDLYRPEPRGLTTALIRPDGRLRGHLAQGVVRALRTPGRTSAATALLLCGGAALTLGAAERHGGHALALWTAGTVGVYLGSGWISETWRGLRDELTLAPLFGRRWGGMPARTLTWPVLAVTLGVAVGGGLASVAPGTDVRDDPGATALLVAGSVVLALGARFLREMKLHLPLALLLPIVTPLGDLSGLRVVVWQFDGLVTVVIGVAVLHAVPSAPLALASAVVSATCCLLAGLHRTGRSYRHLLYQDRGPGR
ncbi:hypothetical protein IF129_11905 [Streptomyces chumphonensis]|uniref:Uncharacterized protein n=1 Tax=Streptomyces chumphonensis TaxID=1214925 RepID=A0A927F0Z8_9ACTN|nr:hypothetical protein [Streptomyces chumphonensis]